IGVGATMKDVQQTKNSQNLIIMLPALAFLFVNPVIQNPNDAMSQFASYFPFTNWIIIIIQNAFSALPTWQIKLSNAILITTTILISLMTAKIFHVSMLMYDKNATPQEIIK